MSTDARQAAQRKYRQSIKGRATRLRCEKRYKSSVLGQEAKQRSAAARIVSGAHKTACLRSYRRMKAEVAVAYGDTQDKRVRLAHPVERVVILSDIQIPFEDPAALDQALEVMDVVRPDLVVLNGDIVDCYQMSSFDKNPKHRKDIVSEGHNRTTTLLKSIEHVSHKVWLGGNHEHRFRRLIWQEFERNGKLGAVANELLTAMGGNEADLAANPDRWFATLYGAETYGIDYYPYGHRLYLAEDNLVVTHGKYVSRHSGQSAKRTLEWLGRSCIVGHTHRMGNHLVTQDGIMYGAWENGCLCQLEPEYDDTPNWQQGFSVVKVSGPEFHVIQVPIVRRGGKPVAVYHGDE